MNYGFTKKAAIDRLEHEIRVSSIKTALNYCNFSEPDVLEVVFKTNLSSEDETTLSSLVSNHIPLPLDLSGLSLEEIQEIMGE